MTFSSLPSQGSTAWYGWATDVHNALTSPTSSAATSSLGASYVQRRAGTATAASPQPFLNVLDYGADPSGAADSSAAFLACANACVKTLAQNTRPGALMYVPAGTYTFASSFNLAAIDTSSLAGNVIQEWGIFCEPAVVFQTGAAFPTNSALVNLGAPSGWQFVKCSFVFGQLYDGHAIAGANGLYVSAVMNSRIGALSIAQFAGSQVLCQAQSTTAGGVFNNYMDFRELLGPGGGSQGWGSIGNPAANAYGVQGNEVHIGRVASCGNGVVPDSGTTGKNSFWNTFHIGAAENNGNDGIQDAPGMNTFYVSNTNSNGAHGYEALSPQNAPSRVRGFITDGFALNGQKGDIDDASTALGNVAAPAVPASTTAQSNTFRRPAVVYVNGGTVTAVAIDGVATGATSGSFRLMPGETITLTYSVAPSWKWFLTAA